MRLWLDSVYLQRKKSLVTSPLENYKGKVNFFTAPIFTAPIIPFTYGSLEMATQNT